MFERARVVRDVLHLMHGIHAHLSYTRNGVCVTTVFMFVCVAFCNFCRYSPFHCCLPIAHLPMHKAYITIFHIWWMNAGPTIERAASLGCEIANSPKTHSKYPSAKHECAHSHGQHSHTQCMHSMCTQTYPIAEAASIFGKTSNDVHAWVGNGRGWERQSNTRAFLAFALSPNIALPLCIRMYINIFHFWWLVCRPTFSITRMQEK